MNIEYKEDKDGITKSFMAAMQNCALCGKKLKPIFKADSSPEDWFWHECDHCEEAVCESCSDTNPVTGEVTCHDCYQTIAMHQPKEQAPAA